MAAAAVAAHECGHVIQHATGYAPCGSVPRWFGGGFASNIVQWVLLLGVLMIKME